MRRVAFFVSLIILFNLSLMPALAVDMPEDWSASQSSEQSAVTTLSAEELEVETYNLFVDTPTLAKGYTAEPFGGDFRVGIFPEVLKEETNITFKNFEQPEKWHPTPFSKIYLTNIYEFDISNKEAFKNAKPVIVEIKYPANSPAYKEAYFWNKPTEEWLPLPTENFPEEHKVRAVIHLPYARIGLFTTPTIMEYGMASWYAYKKCDCAASPDYPKGKFLEVTNLDNNKVIMVMVNDFGPEREKHPDRAIDLDVTAFKKIASKRAGLIKVRVVPIN